MAQSTLRNQVLPIVESDGKHGYRLNKELLKQILHDTRVKNKMVAVLSVAGEYRMGKSFLLNFILRYLITKDKDNWLNLNVALVKLFNYRAGTKTDTKGILAWSEPIMMVDPKSGEELAVILMDTQGSFDNESSREETATIFALSTMVSSYLIYNVSKQLNSNHLENLQYFAKYGELAMDSGNGADEEMPPFQSLLFLVRDWQNSEEMAYGFGGGQQSLDEHLTPKENDTPIMRKLRADIRDKLFQSVRCFLMPEPGKKVKATAYNGDLNVIDEDFLEQMGMLVPGIFANLSAKSINGQALTGRELFASFTTYFEVFKSGEMPKPKSVFEATAEANHQIAKGHAVELYIKLMEKYSGKPKALDEVELEELSCLNECSAIKQFEQAKKFGDAELTDKYRNAIRQEIQRIYEKLVEANKWKAAQNEAEERERQWKAKMAKINEELDELRKDKEANREKIAKMDTELKLTEEKAAKAASQIEKFKSKLDGAQAELKRWIEKGFFQIAGEKIYQTAVAVGEAIIEAPKKIGAAFGFSS